jgi:hypothetical protein
MPLAKRRHFHAVFDGEYAGHVDELNQEHVPSDRLEFSR